MSTIGLSRFLSDAQLAELRFNAEWVLRNGTCPTCQIDLSVPPEDREAGTYWYQNEEHVCPLDAVGMHEQHTLFKHYLLANIRYEYQVLDFAEFPRDRFSKPPADEVLEQIQLYIENFKHIRMSGMGWEISGSKLGVGKTWLGTHILKELVKQGYSCWFASFSEIRGYYEIVDPAERAFKTNKLRMSEVLMIDEILAPWSEAMRNFYEDKLEEVLRFRTASSFPTIVTTNLVESEMKTLYPRCHSLLSAKQNRIELDGEDYRIREAWAEMWRLRLHKETKPII